MNKPTKIRAEYTQDSGTGEPGVDCWVGDEMRSISLGDAIEGNEYNALQDLPGYAEHGESLWVEIDSVIASRLRMDNANLRKQLEHERREREAAQRTIALLGGGE